MFQEMYFHWGEPGRPGSEHTVNKRPFPAEVQIYGFNSGTGLVREGFLKVTDVSFLQTSGIMLVII